MSELPSSFPELEVTISRQDLVRYAGAANDYLPQHWDQAIMQAQGFPDVIVHGWLGFAVLARAASQVFTPDRWILSGYSVRYRHPIYPGGICCGGDIRQVDSGRFEVSGWIRNSAGVIVTTAALAFVPKDGQTSV
jgi:hydroxyacyl-ACP dehydratase HTD2-like protein with hotdog domain